MSLPPSNSERLQRMRVLVWSRRLDESYALVKGSEAVIQQGKGWKRLYFGLNKSRTPPTSL